MTSEPSEFKTARPLSKSPNRSRSGRLLKRKFSNEEYMLGEESKKKKNISSENEVLVLIKEETSQKEINNETESELKVGKVSATTSIKSEKSKVSPENVRKLVIPANRSIISRCVVPGCQNVGGHIFPKKPALRKKWVQFVNKPNWAPVTNRSIVCTKHFLPEDYYLDKLTSGHTIKKLKVTAVPTLNPGKNDENLSVQCVQKQDSTIKSSVTPVKAVTPQISEKVAQDSKQKYSIKIIHYDTDIQKDVNETSNVKQMPKLINPKNLQKVCVRPDEVIPTSTTLEKKQLSKINSMVKNIPSKTESPKKASPKVVIVPNQSKHPQTKIVKLAVAPTTVTDVKDQNKGGKEDFSCQINSFQLLSITDIRKNPKAVFFYTGFKSYDQFMFVFNTLGSDAYDLKYFYAEGPKNFNPVDQFLLCLIILRQHKTHFEMSVLFNLTLKDVKNIFITWIRFMRLEWNRLFFPEVRSESQASDDNKHSNETRQLVGVYVKTNKNQEKSDPPKVDDAEKFKKMYKILEGPQNYIETHLMDDINYICHVLYRLRFVEKIGNPQGKAFNNTS